MDISQSELRAERLRDIASDILVAASKRDALQTAMTGAGETLVSPQARHGAPINPETGAPGRVLRYGDRYREDSVYGP